MRRTSCRRTARMVLGRWFRLAAGLAGIISLTGAYQISLTVNGPTWPPNPIDVTYLSSGAGSTFGALPASAANYASIDIGGGGAAWTVWVARVDSATWDPGLTLSVRRTSAGTGTGSITSGDLNIYKAITTSDQSLFNGTGKLDAIDLQYKLENLTATMGAKTFSTTVRYTVSTP